MKRSLHYILMLSVFLATSTSFTGQSQNLTYPIVETGVHVFYNNSAIISDPLFSTTAIIDPNGQSGQYPYFWTSTTHLDGTNPYKAAVYIAFGKAQGKMNGYLRDVHGAGAQRSDPKTGDPANFPAYLGPQGDVRYVFNYVLCVCNVIGSTKINDPRNPIPHQTFQ
ncbi:MAG: hypothetical protein NT144_10060 [Bacteroidia bacterium]|nr:hypothetical protein [Bacteroidia bacterium]